MVDDKPEDAGSSPDTGRPKREPPTIDLEASEISSETQNTGSGPDAAPEPDTKPKRSFPWPSRTAVSAAVIATVFGAGAAALVIAAASVTGWLAVPSETPAPLPANTAAVDELAARIASVESKAKTPPATAPDPAAAARLEGLEKSLAALRSDLAASRAQAEKVTAAVNDMKSAPRETAPPVDLSAINERLAQIERATRAQTAELAQESNKPADDVPLRRIVASSLLDVLVRVGDPYPAALAAAKSLAENPDALKPLEGFAASGVPSVNALCRDLLTLVPKLAPPAPENTTTGTGIVDRLQAGAAKLVRIERTDAVGNDRGAVVARITAAALRNDLADARRELKTLPPADRAAAQAWLDKADARDAALAASRQFAADAMAALAKPRQ
jgi:hypothetical protein